MYDDVRFGNITSGLPPYAGYAAVSSKADSQLQCANKMAIPTSLQEATACFVPDVVYSLMESLLESRISVYRDNVDEVRLEDCTAVQVVFSLFVYPIFELLVGPMYETIAGTIRQQLLDLTTEAYPIFIVLIVLAVLFQIGAILEIIGMQTHIRRALRLLLHCPASVILQCPKVMSVLSGDFSTRRRDEGAKTSVFFRQVVMQIPDAILTIDTGTMTITSQNTAAERLFGDKTIGTRVVDFFGPHWTGPTGTILAIGADSKGVTEALIFRKDDTTTVNLETTVHTMSDSLVYVFRDTTSTVRYNALIAGERSKSDALLKSILPPSLVPRVQAGEKNISFAVSSVSIVFMDIVSFTPWCGSSTADKVMMTLNCLFKKFDSNCAQQSTMTRIKCIGDCYVAAGGVFSEVNQPLEHAKQVVQFGLDCLQSVNELNVELNESLQIRVGINTGGPIVAGVLGGGAAKPTFEIIGPSINMAQQMEHHGVPMQVHISRSVYELIYGEQFVVKERGSIDVKGVAVVTYLVSEKNQRQRSSV
jgi:class 3 adenylate cyclase